MIMMSLHLHLGFHGGNQDQSLDIQCIHTEFHRFEIYSVYALSFSAACREDWRSRLQLISSVEILLGLSYGTSVQGLLLFSLPVFTHLQLRKLVPSAAGSL